MKKIAALVALVVSLAVTASASAMPGDPDPSVLPACGSNQYYTIYNFDHTVWTCLWGTWYFDGSW